MSRQTKVFYIIAWLLLIGGVVGAELWLWASSAHWSKSFTLINIELLTVVGFGGGAITMLTAIASHENDIIAAPKGRLDE